MKLPITLLCLILSALSAPAQSKFAGDYVGIASPVRWTNLERAVISILVYTDGSISVDAFSYDFDFFPENGGIGMLDAKGKFTVLAENGMLWTGKVSATGGTVRGSASDYTGKYTFTCLRRFRAAHDPLQ